MILPCLLAAVGLAVGCAGCGWRAGGCAPCALLCWLCGLWAVAPACWLWPVVGGAGCAYGLEAVPLVGCAVRLCCWRLCGWRLCGCAVICWPPACWLCALPGGRAPAGRPAVPYGLEAVPLAGCAAGGLEAGRHRGRRSCRPLVPLGAAPCALLLAGRLSAGLLGLAAVTVRATKKAGKMPRKFPAIFPARYFTRTV